MKDLNPFCLSGNNRKELNTTINAFGDNHDWCFYRTHFGRGHLLVNRQKILSSMVFVRGGHRDDRNRGCDLRRSGGNR